MVPSCPHLDYLRELIGKLGLDVADGTVINEHSEEKRKAGIYKT